MPQATIFAPPDPSFRRLQHFAGARQHARPVDRLAAIRRGAAALREELLSQAPVPCYRSASLIRVPYPTRYALLGVATAPTPLVHILNRMFIIQFRTPAGLRTLLASPSDTVGGRETPFFKRMSRPLRFLGPRGEALLAPVLGSVEQALADAGLTPDDVDYISYDHLHTQDLRRWLGPGAYFPRAKLLVMQKEWESAHGLLPTQADWYCPHGLDGVDPGRVVLLDGDTQLGEGVALLHTPGHTEGNHSFVVRTDAGILVTSENGVGADAYAPRSSAIPGVRRHARETGAEVILNGNTLEGSVDQYLSMMEEREVAGPCPQDPSFYNVVPSSELTAYWAFPGIRPTFSFGDLRFGQATRRA